jgi:hypothetical protein
MCAAADRPANKQFTHAHFLGVSLFAVQFRLDAAQRLGHMAAFVHAACLTFAHTFFMIESAAVPLTMQFDVLVLRHSAYVNLISLYECD